MFFICAAVVVVLLFSERLGIPIDLGAAGFNADDMPNWGILLGLVVAAWGICTPSKSRAKASAGKG